MSFSNDEDGDGLAALFGGITPQAAPGEQPGRRQADATPPAGEPAPAAPEPEPAAQPPYPGLAPQQPAPSAYPPPAAAPAAPAYEMPAPASAPAPQAPQGYDLPAPAAPAGGAAYAPPATPQYPGLAPTPEYPTPAYPATPDPAPYQPPAAAPYPAASPSPGPAPTPQDPAYPPTAQYPTGVDPASYAAPAGPVYGAPAADPPAYQPPTYQAPPASAPPAYEPTSYTAPPPAYVPPAQEAPPAYEPPPASEHTPAYEPPTYAAPPVVEQPTFAAPPPIVEPPAFSGFEALGLQPTTPAAPEPSAVVEPPVERSFVEQPRAEEPPTETSYGEHPIVRAEAAPLASVFPPGPLLPVPTEGRIEETDDLARSTVLEKVGLGLAVLAGPIGLLLAIVNAIRGARRRGWVIGIGRASLVLGVLSTIVFAIGGYALWNMRLDQLQHDQVAAASAEFCAAADADPSLVTPPTLGWPRPGETITDSLALMQAWTDDWRALAATSPAELRDGMNLLAERGGVIIDAVTGSRSIDDAANQQQISSIEAQSGVSSWYVTYCVEP